jgi:serine protease AprX
VPRARRPTGPPAEVINNARTRTRAELGSAVESKATDDFCIAFASAMPAALAEAFASGTGFASVGGLMPLRTPAIVELAPTPEAEVEAARALVAEFSRIVQLGGRESFSNPAAASTAARAAQQAGVAMAREQFFKRAGLIRDDMERATSAVLRNAPVRGHTPEEERLLVEVCWLNETLRTADARSISNIAGDPGVQRVDLPRPLAPDAVPPSNGPEQAAGTSAGGDLTGRGVTVAVIDSECALGHPGLADRVIHRRNFTREPWGTPDGHGTAVAGIIGANSQVRRGIAPDAMIYNYKVLATHIGFNATDFQGAVAIQQALEDGARIANCSWGAGRAGDGTSREARACDRAWEFGLTVVKSAGNAGPTQRTLTSPADAEGVVVVGATGTDGRTVQPYSSRGPTPNGRARPHLVAPGGGPDDELTGLLTGGGVGDIGHGTSFAAPYVTGVLALLLEQNPELSPDMQRDRLLQACKKLGGGSKNAQGVGLLLPELLFGAP